MPKIPRREREVSIQSRQTAPRVNPQSFGQEGRTIEQLGDVVLAAEETFSKINDQHQIIRAENKARQAFQQIKEEAENDPDPFTADQRAETRLRELGNTLSSEISSPFAKQRFARSFGASSFAVSSSIRKRARERQIETVQADLFSRDDQLVRDYFATENPNEKNMIVQTIQTGVAEAQANLGMDPLKAKQYLDERLEEMRTGQALHDLSNMPVESVIEQLEAGDKGRYANLEPKERIDLLKDARRLQDKQMKQFERMVDKVEDSTEEKTALRINNNEIDIDELGELLQGRTNQETGEFEKIGLSFYDKAVKRLTKIDNDPKIPKEEKAKVYADLLTEFIQLGRDEDVTGFQFGLAEGNDLATIRAFREKVIENASFLTQSQSDMFLESTQSNFIEAQKPKISWLQRIGEFAKSGTLGAAEERFAELGERYLSLINGKEMNEEEYAQTAKKVMDDDLKARNPNRRAFEIGQSIKRASGSYEVIGFNDNGDPIFRKK